MGGPRVDRGRIFPLQAMASALIQSPFLAICCGAGILARIKDFGQESSGANRMRRWTVISKWFAGSLVLLAVQLHVAITARAQHNAANPPSVARTVVPLKNGESKKLQLCWGDGTGRIPVVFLTSSPNQPANAEN